MNSPARLAGSRQLLTHDEAATHLHVCPRTLRSIRQRGLIPYVAVTARKILYRVEDVDAFVAASVRSAEHKATERRHGKRSTAATNVVSFSARRKERLAAKGG